VRHFDLARLCALLHLAAHEAHARAEQVRHDVAILVDALLQLSSMRRPPKLLSAAGAKSLKMTRQLIMSPTRMGLWKVSEKSTVLAAVATGRQSQRESHPGQRTNACDAHRAHGTLRGLRPVSIGRA